MSLLPFTIVSRQPASFLVIPLFVVRQVPRTRVRRRGQILVYLLYALAGRFSLRASGPVINLATPLCEQARNHVLAVREPSDTS